MKRLLSVVLLLLSCTAFPAHACMAPEFENDIFLDEVPADIPSDALIFRVENDLKNIAEGKYDPFGISVKVVEVVRGDFANSVLPIKLTLWSSCSRWGSRAPVVYIVGFWARDGNGETFLDPIQYKKPDKSGRRAIGGSPHDRPFGKRN